MELIQGDRNSVYRLLGAEEQMLWLGDIAHPMHFAMTAQIKGKFSIEQLKQALALVQQRHPLLRVRIALDEAGQPCFVEADTSIPVRVVQRQGEQHWQREVERELSIPFVFWEAPLVRVVLLHSTDVSELILTCYHPISDGMSAAYLIRDILQAIAIPEANTNSLPLPPSLEDLVPRKTDENPLPLQPTNTRIRNQAELTQRSQLNTQNSDFRDCLYSGSLSKETTTLLISRCRHEQTTVHGAICAAFLLALIRQNSSEQPQILKCFSAINIRRYLIPPVGEDVGLYVSAELTSHTLTADGRLWDVARSLKQQLNRGMASETIFRGIPQVEVWMSENPSPSQVLEGMLEEYGCDLLVANLGRLSLPQKFGDLELQAIYGPATITGMEKKAMVAIATLGDRLFFVLVCPHSLTTFGTAENLKKDAMQLLNAAIETPSPV
ncbi:condensation domain-containing protein [Aerosakkonema sp. BLCC-F183]|uniref:phthiocerol/phthiodiolone dimycocerosyl transferase family protein n=1 Tax=Aerosakkonema sp. BLCC-F183 TaxID=3342834 RepID=UPI0035B956AB